MTSQGFDCGDRMGLVDRVHYAFNSVMSLRTEMTVQEDKMDEKIQDLSREVKSLVKQVQELREILQRQDQDMNSFIDDEAVEVNLPDSEEDPDQEEVTFVGATWVSSKKRRLE